MRSGIASLSFRERERTREEGREGGQKVNCARTYQFIGKCARARAESADYFAIAKPPLTSFAIATDTNNWFLGRSTLVFLSLFLPFSIYLCLIFLRAISLYSRNRKRASPLSWPTLRNLETATHQGTRLLVVVVLAGSPCGFTSRSHLKSDMSSEKERDIS